MSLSAKTGHCFIESLSNKFNEVAEEWRNSNVALYYAMVMPHMVLARTKENRETSTGKTIQRRMEAWLSCEFEALFNEAKALQLRIPKVRKTQNPNVQVSQKSNVLSLQEIVGKKTVVQIFQAKHPQPMTSGDSYITNNNELHH